jgi:ABC-type multidrug transport system fused ATPase/permease subunit
VLKTAQLINFTYTVMKFLALSEHSQQLYCAGVWASCGWNLLSLLLIRVLCKHLQPSPEAQGYNALVNSEETPTAATANGHAVSNGHASNGQSSQNGSADASDSSDKDKKKEEESSDSLTNLSTLKQIVLLTRYSLYYWPWVLVGGTLTSVYAIVQTLEPLYTAKVIDAIVSGTGGPGVAAPLLILLTIIVVSTLLDAVRSAAMSYASALVAAKIRTDLFAAITRQEIGFFDATPTGDVLSRLTSDCMAMTSSLNINVGIFTRTLFTIGGSVVVMMGLSWRLTLVTLAFAPTLSHLTALSADYFRALAAKTQDRLAEATAAAQEVVSSMRTVRSFACEQRECRVFNERLEGILKVERVKAVGWSIYGAVWDASAGAILIIVLLYGGHLVLGGRMSKASIVAFLLYQMRMNGNFQMLNMGLTGLMKSVGASRKIFQYLNRIPKIDHNSGHITGAHRSGGSEVEFRSVSLTYPTRPDTEVLHSISFKVSAGETVALVGPSGSGKSSIISLIERFYEPQEGEILLDGVPINQLDHAEYHRRVALVAQEPMLYSCSVRDNILYGCGEKDGVDGHRTYGEEEMMEAAKEANIHDFITGCKEGYDTRCGEKGVLMSGGQKQRIAIARALVRQPSVLILDEATSALDSESEALIQEALRRCSLGKTVIVIAHRLSTVEHADRILVLDNHTIVQSGRHEELMRDTDGLYHSLVQKQLTLRE